MENKTYTTADFKRWGSQGGAISTRTLTREQSLAMLKLRRNGKRLNKAKRKASERLKGGR